jgi:hypothetical protein
MNQFTERYKRISNSDLLKVIATPEDYQPLAIVAAKIEIANRQLSDQEITNAKAELELQRQQKEEQNQKKKEIKNKVKSFGSSFIDNINPIQTTTRTTNKTILIISIVLGGLSIINIYKYGMLKYMFTNSDARWDFSVLIYFFPLIILPLGTFLFWRRKKLGWSLLSIYFTYIAIGVIISFILELNTKPTGIPAFDSLTPKDLPLINIWSFIFNGGCLWVLCKENIRNVYSIGKRQMYNSIGIAVALTVLTMVGMFM